MAALDVLDAPPAQDAAWSRRRRIAFRLAVVAAVWSFLRFAVFLSNYVYFSALKRALGPVSAGLFRIDSEMVIAVGAFVIRRFTGNPGTSAEVVARFNFSLVYLV